MKNLKELFRGLRRPRVSPTETVLPYSVRYALSYGEAQFGKGELTELVEAGSSFIPTAIYLTIKALNEDPERQKTFLSEVTKQALDNPNDISTLKPLVLNTIANLAPEVEVLGTKLAQFSRQGFEVWDERFRNCASALLREEETPVLVAYSTLAGLIPFIDTFKGSGRPIYILTPKWTQDQTTPFCGYRINTDDVDPVQLLRKDFQRPEKFVVIRDTARPFSDKIRAVWNFWNKEVRDVDESRIRLLCSSN